MFEIQLLYQAFPIRSPLEFFQCKLTREAIKQDLEMLEKDVKLEDNYFYLLNGMFHVYFDNRQFELYINTWDAILHVIKSSNPSRFAKMHKGTPYYFKSVAAYLCEDFTRALFYMDCAVAEDCENARAEWKKLPAGLFIRLVDDDDNQFAKQLTGRTRRILDSALEDYRQESGDGFTLTELRQRFFGKAVEENFPWRSACTALITFALEYDTRRRDLNLASKHGMSNEPFFLHLFKGGLLFETLLKVCPAGSKKEYRTANLGELLQDKDSEIRARLRLPKGFEGMGRKSLDEVVQEVTNLAKSKNPFPERVVGATWGIRNTTGHNLAWGTKFTLDQYEILFKCLIFACFLAISRLFPK